MQKYQNETYSKGSSTFVGVNPVDGSHVRFRSTKKKFRVSGVDAVAVTGSVFLAVPTEVTDTCNECLVTSADSTIELKFNYVGGVNAQALRTELLRLYDAAVLLHLEDGLVPNVNANLDGV